MAPVRKLRPVAVMMLLVLLGACSDGADEVASTVQTRPVPGADSTVAQTSAPPTTAPGVSIPDSDQPTTVPPATVPPSTIPSTTAPSATDPYEDFEHVVASGAGSSVIAARYGLGGPRQVDADGDPVDGADGSGCEPGPGDLPDGVWLVAIENVALGTTGVAVDVDLLCRYSGDNAYDRFPDEPVEDEWISNDVTATRRMRLGETATFHPGYCFHDPSLQNWEDPGPALDANAVFTDLVEGDDRFAAFVEFLHVWVLVEDGEITEVFDGFYLCAG